MQFISPNFISFLGLVMAVGAFIALANANLPWGAFWILLSGVCDMADGRWARHTKTESNFGAFWDSCLDRLGDAFYLGGLWFYFYNIVADDIWLYFSFSALVAGFGVSYVKARYEGLGLKGRPGFWERPERMVVLLAGLFAQNPEMTVAILGTVPYGTMVRRILWAHPRLVGANPRELLQVETDKNRRNLAYIVQLTLALAAVVFVRLT